MFNYKRIEDIFNYIRSNDYTTAAKLSDLFKVSERTIRTDINNLNNELQGASVQLKRKAGYYLEIEDEDTFNSFLDSITSKETDFIDLDSSEDRIRFILNKLLYSHDYISTDELADLVYVSKNTFSNYIKIIKKSLPLYNLEYIVKPGVGIKIIGNESDKRDCIVNETYPLNEYSTVSAFSKGEKIYYNDVEVNYIVSLLINVFNKHEIQTDDYKLKNLTIYFALMISRILNDDYISVMNNTEIPNNIEEIMNEICESLSNYYDITITRGEKQYISLHFISNIKYNNNSIDDQSIHNLIDSFLEGIYKGYNFDLRDDKILRSDLFYHFRTSISMMELHLENKNPLLNTIKTNYPLPFEISKTILSQSSNIITFPEDDIGYIALHIGAAIERCFSGSIKKKAVYLVCGSGQATARMLEARLHNVFANKLTVVKRLSLIEYLNCTENDFKEIDCVISTIPLDQSYVPTITVDFSLNQQDIEMVSRLITSIDQSKYEKIKKFFDSSLFVHKKKVNSKKELLEELSTLLLNEDIIGDDYLDSVYKREELSNTNMNDVFALPHPLNVFAKQTKVAVAILDEPLKWNGDETVRIVFLLAIKNGDSLNMEHLYDVFIELVNNTKFQREVMCSKTYDQFIKILIQHIQ